MKTLLFIDCCIRAEQSRTKIIADAFLDEFFKRGGFKMETVNLDSLHIFPLSRESYERREKLIAENRLNDTSFDLARQFAKADLIVVAAPFWDMGIPAKLKTYFENVSVSGFTFKCDESGCVGLCNADKMIYITTRGMDIEDGSVMEQASPYLYALTKFFNIRGFDMISAYGLDVDMDKVNETVSKAVERAKNLARSLK